MASKRTKNSGHVLLTWFILGGLALLFAPQSLTARFQLAFAYIFRRPLSIGRDVALAVREPFSEREAVSRDQYERLRNHLSNTAQWLHHERQKVETLSGLRDRTVWEGVSFVLADVITASIRGPHNQLIINRGSSDGLAKGQFVLADYSVIGTVSKVNSRTAQVTLVTDVGSRVPIGIAESDTGTIMQGYGDNAAKVALLPTKHTVKVGDLIYAQKKPGFLDIPMVVGVVSDCQVDGENPLLWDIVVKPACRIDELKDVTVIVANPREQVRGDIRKD
ncbi:MAG: rod shape-determining protein MreC [Planctomycetota bacterium]